MNQGKISIIICCYNGATRIEKVLDHIYMQDKLEENVEEIIFVDNNSSDETKQKVKSYKNASDSVPIRYIFESNPGLSNARKAGVGVCETEWIAFLDDDNYLHQGWIVSVSNYVKENKNIGVFNGAVIPLINFSMTDEECANLRASLKVLACTHFDENELQKNPKSPFRNPIGAGMVIKTAPLKKLLNNGWLDSEGRTKDNLISGEDGEMAFYVRNQGYDFGFCKDAIIDHHISANRLQVEYLNKMWFEIGRGVAVVAKKQNTGFLKLLCYSGLLILRRMAYSIISKKRGSFYSEYIKGYHYELQK